MRLITSKVLGPLALQHEGYDKAGFDLDYRACLYGARIKDQLDKPGDIGHWLGDQNSIGDINGWQLWTNDRAKRPVPMWRAATPVVVASGGKRTNNVPTDGGKKGGCGHMPGNGVSMVPVFDRAWTPDDRFKPLQAEVPKRGGERLWPKFPVGSVGLSVTGNKESSQEDLFLPCDPGLYAVNFAGDAEMGSLVCDLNDKFEVDPKRTARLQSVFRVVKKPLGKKFNVIALQLGPSGCEDTEGGYVIDRPNGGAAIGGPGRTVVGKAGGGDNRVLGLLSVNEGGPLDVGTGLCTHKKGVDDDGHAIDSCHITTKALFRRNDTEDGPLDFTIYKRPGADGNIRVPVYLGWRGDVWAWWTTNWFLPPPPPDIPTIPTDPIKPDPIHPEKPGDGTTTGGGGTSTGGGGRVNAPIETPVTAPFEGPIVGEPGGSGATSEPPAGPSPNPPPDGGPERDDPVGDRIRKRQRQAAEAQGQIFSGVINSSADLARSALNVVTMTAALGLQAMMAVPQNYGDGMADQGLTFSEALKDSTIQKIQSGTPMAGGLSSFGAQGGTKESGSDVDHQGAKGDPWVFNQEPGRSKYPGGTCSGGFVVHPPETDLRDAALYGMAPTGVALSTTYFLTAPGAWFGAGVPELVDGSIKEGLSWGMDSATGDLLFRSHSGISVPSTAFRLSKTAQNFSWRSETSFWGEFDHTNTADRVYTFKDADGTVAFTSDIGGVSIGAAVTSGTTGSVLYVATGPVLAQDNSYLFYNSSSKYLGVGNGAPAAVLHGTQQTHGSAVVRMETVAPAGDNIKCTTYQRRVATTDATQTILHAHTCPASTTSLLEFRVVARRTGGIAGTAEDGAAYVIRGTYKVVGGTATLIGSVTTEYSAESQAGWDATLDVSGDVVRLQVTGAADNNVSWQSTLTTVEVGS